MHQARNCCSAASPILPTATGGRLAGIFTRNHPSTVREVRLPEGSLAAGAFAVTHYADAFALSLPPGATHDVDALLRMLASSAPAWVEALMRIRNAVVSPLGLKTDIAAGSVPTRDAPFQRGDRAGIFTVFDRTEDEILAGGDDRHLDFRGSLLIRPEGSGHAAVLSTVVHYNRTLGRVYFFFVRPFHRLIIPSTLRRLARNLDRASRH